MTTAHHDDVRSAPELISWEVYQGLEGRIIRLEEFSKHAATREWVYKIGFGAMGVVATLAASGGVVLVRVLFGV